MIKITKEDWDAEIHRLNLIARTLLDEVRDFVNEAYGECCPDHCEDCIVCLKHSQVDKLFEDFSE